MTIVGWVGVNNNVSPSWLFWCIAIIGSIMLAIRICKGFSGDGDFLEDLVESGSDSFFDGGSSSGGSSSSWDD